eukprot:5292016-Amphidinium_carterae.1
MLAITCTSHTQQASLKLHLDHPHLTVFPKSEVEEQALASTVDGEPDFLLGLRGAAAPHCSKMRTFFCG